MVGFDPSYSTNQLSLEVCLPNWNSFDISLHLGYETVAQMDYSDQSGV